MKRVLVTGGSLGDVPIIKSLKNDGHFVVTSGNTPNDIGHKFSDLYDQCDYTDAGGLLALCNRRKIDFVIPSAHDLAAVAASEVASEMQLPGFDTPRTSRIIHDKVLLRDSIRDSGCLFPEYFGIRSLIELERATLSLGFPVIIKPVDLTGGNGISICHNEAEAEFAFLRAFNISPSNSVIIESYLEGTYHGITCIIENGKVIFSFADNEYYLYDKFRVSATSSPSSLSKFEIYDAVSQIESLSKHLSLCDGLLHAQVLRNETGIYIIEVCRRTPGDFYPKFVEQSTGLDYSSIIAHYFLGSVLKNELKVITEPIIPTLRIMIMPTKRGVFRCIDGLSSYKPSMHFLWRKKGEFIDEPRKWTAGILIFSKDDGFDEDSISKIRDAIKVIVD
jgi:biotin carboxylase